MKMNLKDEELKVSSALPSAASGSSVTDALQLKSGKDPQGGFYAECELLVSIPALTDAILPAETSVAEAGSLTVKIETADADTEAGWAACETVTLATLEAKALGGLDATELRYRFPTNVKAFARVKFTLNATASDASAKTAEAWLVF